MKDLMVYPWFQMKEEIERNCEARQINEEGVTWIIDTVSFLLKSELPISRNLLNVRTSHKQKVLEIADGVIRGYFSQTDNS